MFIFICVTHSRRRKKNNYDYTGGGIVPSCINNVITKNVTGQIVDEENDHLYHECGGTFAAF